MTPEGYVKDAVLALLAVERIYALRVNSGNLLLTAPNGKKRMVKLADRGTADILALIPIGDGSFIPLWIETKAPKKGLRPEQADFREDVVSRGHAYIIARSSDDVLDWLRAFRASVK